MSPLFRPDARHNWLSIDNQRFHFSHRWEATLLTLMAQHLREGDGLPLELAEFQEHIAKLGQRRPLDRTGMRRLLQSLQSAFVAALGDGGFTTRVRTHPRHGTVGPYWLHVLPGDEWHLPRSEPHMPARAAHRVSVAPPLRLTVDGSSAAAREVVRHFMVADDLFRQGRFQATLDELVPLACRDGLSPDCRALVLLRMSLAHERQRQWSEARSLLREVARMARHDQLTDKGLGLRAEHLATRILYNAGGAGSAPVVLARLRAALTQPEACCNALLWEIHKLGAQAELRLLKDSTGPTQALPEGRWDTLAVWSELQAGLYWALAAHSHEGAQNLCSQIGAHLQELYCLGLLPQEEAREIFGWYGLALAYNERFSLGEDSVRDRVSLGNLWLRCPQLRAELNNMGHLVIGNHLPHEAKFHTDTVARAVELGDVHQIALATHNAWQFGRESCQEDLARRHEAQLRRLLRGQKVLRLQMRKDGYEV